MDAGFKSPTLIPILFQVKRGIKETKTVMRRTRSIERRRLGTNAAKRSMMFKKTRKKILQRRREFVRAELAEQWQVAC